MVVGSSRIKFVSEYTFPVVPDPHLRVCSVAGPRARSIATRTLARDRLECVHGGVRRGGPRPMVSIFTPCSVRLVVPVWISPVWFRGWCEVLASDSQIGTGLNVPHPALGNRTIAGV